MNIYFLVEGDTEEKVYKAFMEFDVEGTGSQIKSD